MSRRLPVLVALFTTLAGAQQTTPILFTKADDPTIKEFVFGAESCGKTIRMRWSYQAPSAAATACDPLKLFVTKASACPETQADTDFGLPSVSIPMSGATGTVDLTLDNSMLLGFSVDAGCGTQGIEVSHRLCGHTKILNLQALTCSTVQNGTDFRLVYDAKPPTPPVIDSVTNEDKALKINFSVSGDTTRVTARAKASGSVDFVFSETINVSESVKFIRLTGLKNAQLYDIQLQATDAAGNVSDPSALSSGTPTQTLGFWGVVKENKSTEPGGGCATMPSAFAAIALLLMLRRRFS
jgi:hypothetical protein